MRIAKALVAVFTALTFIINTAPRSYADDTYYVRILSANVNIRKGPGKEYDVVGRTGKAGSFIYTGSQFDSVDILWYRIEDKSGFTGWVSSDFSRRYMKKDAFPDFEKPEKYVSDGTVMGDVREYVENTASDALAIGAQVCAIRGSDGKIFDWTYGWSKYGVKKMGNGTKIRAASISKVAVAICAMKMQDMGIVDMNKKIDKYWGDKLPKKVSLTTLFTHSSTLRYLGMKTNAEDTLKQLIQPGNYTEGKPGKAASWSYNNYASAVAASTLEMASDTVLEDFAQENLFGPLGVDMSFFAGNLKDTKRLATLYEADDGIELTVSEAKELKPDGVVGANCGNYIGGMTGSAKDIAKMFYMLANDGLFKGQQILSPEAVEAMEKRYFKAEEYGGKFRQAISLRYGKGFCNTKGIYYHTGNAYGVIALASYDPETKNTVVVLTTGASHSRDKNGVYKVCTDIAGEVYKNIDEL